jgi:hypothetical protein
MEAALLSAAVFLPVLAHQRTARITSVGLLNNGYD